jgi:hypothetical protein
MITISTQQCGMLRHSIIPAPLGMLDWTHLGQYTSMRHSNFSMCNTPRISSQARLVHPACNPLVTGAIIALLSRAWWKGRRHHDDAAIHVACVENVRERMGAGRHQVDMCPLDTPPTLLVKYGSQICASSLHLMSHKFVPAGSTSSWCTYTASTQ